MREQREISIREKRDLGFSLIHQYSYEVGFGDLEEKREKKLLWMEKKTNGHLGENKFYLLV